VARAHDGFALVAGADVDRDAREAARRELGLAETAVHDAPEPALQVANAVIVATPPERHADACRAALERGLAVLVEKPFTLDLATARELVELAADRGAPLLVAHTYRHLRVHTAARALVRSGRLGTVRQLDCRHYRIEPRPAAQGEHGTLWDLGAHHLDAIVDLVGEAPSAVLATSFDGGLSAQVLLEFGDFARASYSVTRRSSGHEFFEGGKEHYLRVVGERGTLHVLHRWLVLCESGRLPRLLRRSTRRRSEEAHMLDALAAAIRGAGHDAATGRDATATVAMLDACVRSAAGRCWVAPEESSGG
jgi:predicted dehydrogenase